MNNRINDELKDLYCCPISLQPIRHPALASDGRHYELSMLCDWLGSGRTISPITREPILHVTYDYALKNRLDSLSLENRHQNYEKNTHLFMLANTINSAYKPGKQSFYKSIMTAHILVILYASYSLLLTNEKELKASSLLLCLFVGGIADYIRRSCNQYGLHFFRSEGENANNWIYHLPSTQHDDSDEEILNPRII